MKTWTELLGHRARCIEGLVMPSTGTRLQYLRLERSSLPDDELSKLRAGKLGSVSVETWLLTNVSSIDFAHVSHRLYHKPESFRRLVAFLDNLLLTHYNLDKF